MKHPVLLARNSEIAVMIIRCCHEDVAHCGRGITINYIRSSGFWIINCNAAVRSYISKCVACRHLRGNFKQQKMASLPSDRLCEEPPFTYCGVDIFRPFVTKDGRKELKRHGPLFTCLSSRAIHIERVFLLNTHSIILCLCRFVGRRGNIRLLRSFGTIPNDESLHTFLIEVESIANSCLLTIDLLSDVNGMILLSPIHLSTLKSRVVVPPSGVFTAADIYCCKHWRRVQHISN